MVDYFDRSGQYIRGAIGPADLTAFNNAQAAIVVGELFSFDRLYGKCEIDWCEPKTIEIDSTSPPIRLVSGRTLGKAIMPTYFMTGILDYLVMGTCVTTEATPNIHDISFATGNDPPRFAIHAEKEETNNPQRDDGMAWISVSDDIYVSEKDTIAKRITSGQFGYSGAGGDLVKTAALSLATHRPYDWFDYKNSSGASAFTLNAGAIGFEIMSLHIHKGWSGALFTAYNGTGYPTVGKYIKPYEYYVNITGLHTDTGTAIQDIVKLTPAALAAIGDLDFIADFYQTATKNHKSTFDKMFIPKETYKESYVFSGGSWFPGHSFQLRPLDNTSSLVIQENNTLNNDSYENPA